MKNVIQAFILMSFISAQAWASGWTSMSGRYEVPVSDDLRAFASFELTDLKVREKDGSEELKYTLPLKLTGEPVEVHLKKGKDYNCSATQCRVSYPDLFLDEVKVADHLSSLNLGDQEFSARMEVFSLFRNDPEGIIYFDTPQVY